MTKAVKGTPRRRTSREEDEAVVSTALDGANGTEHAPSPSAAPSPPPEPPAPPVPGAPREGTEDAGSSDVLEKGRESRPPESNHSVMSPPTLTRVYSRAELKAIVGKPRIKGQVPTLVRFRDSDSVPIRTVLVDIGEPLLREGWEYFHRMVPDGDPSDYLGEIYALTETEVPRLWKVVAELRLNC